jgi:cell division septal protein FtsQ
MTPRRRRLVLGVVAGGILVVLAQLGLRRLEFFQIRRVEVLGLRYLDGREIVQALRLARGSSLFGSLGGLAQRAEQVRGVVRAEVGRRWPGTLVVRVTEAEPVALAQNRGVLAPMDGRGRILPFDPTRAPTDLPVAAREPSVAQVLERVKEAEPGLFARIGGAFRAGRDVVLTLGERRLLLRPGTSSDAIRAVAAVLEDLNRRQRTFREIDARFTDRIIVRGMKQS